MNNDCYEDKEGLIRRKETKKLIDCDKNRAKAHFFSLYIINFKEFIKLFFSDILGLLKDFLKGIVGILYLILFPLTITIMPLIHTIKRRKAAIKEMKNQNLM